MVDQEPKKLTARSPEKKKATIIRRLKAGANENHDAHRFQYLVAHSAFTDSVRPGSGRWVLGPPAQTQRSNRAVRPTITSHGSRQAPEPTLQGRADPATAGNQVHSRHSHRDDRTAGPRPQRIFSAKHPERKFRGLRRWRAAKT